MPERRGSERFIQNIVGPAVQHECLKMAQEIVQIISTSPQTPVRKDPDGNEVGGRLKSSYSARETEDGGAEVVTSAPYWKYVEYGAGRGPKQPHVRPAVEQVRAGHT